MDNFQKQIEENEEFNKSGIIETTEIWTERLLRFLVDLKPVEISKSQRIVSNFRKTDFVLPYGPGGDTGTS